MFKKTVSFLFSVGWIGLCSVPVALFAYAILALAVIFAMIPVAIIFGENITNYLVKQIGTSYNYTAVYVVVFIGMLAREYGISNIKTLLLKLRMKKTAG